MNRNQRLREACRLLATAINPVLLTHDRRLMKAYHEFASHHVSTTVNRPDDGAWTSGLAQLAQAAIAIHRRKYRIAGGHLALLEATAGDTTGPETDQRAELARAARLLRALLPPEPVPVELEGLILRKCWDFVLFTTGTDRPSAGYSASHPIDLAERALSRHYERAQKQEDAENGQA